MDEDLSPRETKWEREMKREVKWEREDEVLLRNTEGVPRVSHRFVGTLHKGPKYWVMEQ